MYIRRDASRVDPVPHLPRKEVHTDASERKNMCERKATTVVYTAENRSLRHSPGLRTNKASLWRCAKALWPSSTVSLIIVADPREGTTDILFLFSTLRLLTAGYSLVHERCSSRRIVTSSPSSRTGR